MANRENQAVHAALLKHLAVACHDISDGGTLVALVEMAFGSIQGDQFGLEIDIPASDLRPDHWLFSETGGYLLEVDRAQEQTFLDLCQTFALHPVKMGKVTTTGRLRVAQTGRPLLDCPLEGLYQAWHNGFSDALRH